MKETANIRLRALKESDIWLLHQWVNDPEVVKYTSYFHPVSEMEQKEWFATIHKQKNKVMLGIEVKEDGKLIGTCGFNDIDYISRKAESFVKVGDKDSWGKGYGKEILEILVDFGIRHLNLRKIVVRMLADNERAIKLIKRAGWIMEGIMKEDHYVEGEYKDMVVMAYIKKE